MRDNARSEKAVDSCLVMAERVIKSQLTNLYNTKVLQNLPMSHFKIARSNLNGISFVLCVLLETHSSLNKREALICQFRNYTAV